MPMTMKQSPNTVCFQISENYSALNALSMLSCEQPTDYFYGQYKCACDYNSVQVIKIINTRLLLVLHSVLVLTARFNSLALGLHK